ncbi:hypothetical protein J6590_044561 [Homalodisca vitripennis]|nr:hypothetical protein J6590_044561 [Homalodisca vitripennis]
MDHVVLYAAYRQFVNKKCKRRCSVHPINNARYSDGACRNLYGILREHDDKFFNYLRMSISSFDELVVKFKETIEIRPELVRGLAFSVEEMLTISLTSCAMGAVCEDDDRVDWGPLFISLKVFPLWEDFELCDACGATYMLQPFL